MWARAWLFALLIGACSAPPVSDDAGTDAGRELAAPAPVPRLALACPEGWRARTLYEADICEPWPEDTAPRCADGELAVLGQPAGSECQPVWPCPTGEWPDDAPADAVYVRAGATGDGTRASPMGDLGDALDLARTRSVAVVIGEGEHDGSYNAGLVPLVMGLCPARSRIHTSSSHALTVLNGTTEVRGLSLVSDSWVGLEVGERAVVRVNGVAASGDVNGIRVRTGGVLEADRVLVRGPAVDDPARFVTALEVHYGGQATLRHADLSGGGGGIAVPVMSAAPIEEGFGTVVLEDSVVHDVPYALVGAAEATLRRVAIERAPIGVLVLPFRTVSMEDVRVRDIGETTYNGGSVGLVVANGRLVLRRVAISQVRGYAVAALAAEGRATVLDAEDLFVADTDQVVGPTFDDQIAVLVSGAMSTATIHRAHLAELRGNAIQVEYGSLVASDVRVIDARAVGDSWGHALQVFAGTLELTRADVRPELFGLFVVERSHATVTDFEQRGGLGIHLQCVEGCVRDETTLSLSTASLHDIRRVGILVSDAVVQLTDVDIHHVASLALPIAVDDIPPTGVVVIGATVTGERVHVSDLAGIGVLAYETGDVVLSDVDVERVDSIDCECGPAAYGDGLLWGGGATVTAHGFEIRDVDRAGLVAALGFGSAALDGWVRGSGVGLITDPRTPVDLSLFSGVHFEGNGVATLAAEVAIGVTESSPWRYAPVSAADPSGIGF